MKMNREYVIVSNKHKGIFSGCLLFWGHLTNDTESRSYGGYTSDFNKCERYTFPLYNGEDEIEFKKIENVIIRIDDLLAFDWLKTMTVVYRP